MPARIPREVMDKECRDERTKDGRQGDQPDGGSGEKVERRVLGGVQGLGEADRPERGDRADNPAAEDEVPLAPQPQDVKESREFERSQALERRWPRIGVFGWVRNRRCTPCEKPPDGAGGSRENGP